jgi:hypothetical protein
MGLVAFSNNIQYHHLNTFRDSCLVSGQVIGLMCFASEFWVGLITGLEILLQVRLGMFRELSSHPVYINRSLDFN